MLFAQAAMLQIYASISGSFFGAVIKQSKPCGQPKSGIAEI